MVRVRAWYARDPGSILVFYKFSKNVNLTFFLILTVTSALMNLAFKPRTLDMKINRPNSSHQQVVILAGLHVVGHDFSNEFPFSGIRVIHKISVNLFICFLPESDSGFTIILRCKV